MDDNRNSISCKRKWLLTLLFLAPALLMVDKSFALPTSDFLWRWFSFGHLPVSSAHRLQYVLFVPLGAVVVVFFRQTLGVRLLGPFRSCLTAVGFKTPGILPVFFFFFVVMGISVPRPPLPKTLRLPY